MSVQVVVPGQSQSQAIAVHFVPTARALAMALRFDVFPTPTLGDRELLTRLKPG